MSMDRNDKIISYENKYISYYNIKLGNNNK